MAATEKRTQIYLTRAQHGALVRVARQRGTSLAGVVREAVDRYIEIPSGSSRAADGTDPLGDLIGIAEGPGDLSDRHDDYLYGPARKGRR